MYLFFTLKNSSILHDLINNKYTHDKLLNNIYDIPFGRLRFIGEFRNDYLRNLN